MIGSTLVHNDDLAPSQQAPRQGQKLPLSLAEVAAAGANRCIEGRDANPTGSSRSVCAGSSLNRGGKVRLRVNSARRRRRGRPRGAVGEAYGIEDVPEVFICVFIERI